MIISGKGLPSKRRQARGTARKGMKASLPAPTLRTVKVINQEKGYPDHGSNLRV